MRLSVALAVLAGLAASSLPSGYRVLVASESGDIVTQLTWDGSALAVAKVVPVGIMPADIDGPHNVAAAPDGSAWYVVTPPEALEAVKEALAKAGITPASAEIGMVPQNYVKLTGAQAQQMLRLVETLEEHDDVQHVYANFDIDESEIQAAVGAN